MVMDRRTMKERKRRWQKAEETEEPRKRVGGNEVHRIASRKKRKLKDLPLRFSFSSFL